MSQETRQASEPAAAMRRMRGRVLAGQPADFRIAPSNDCARVYGVVMDWPVDDETVTVVALCDGNASLYTTGTFGVIGGGKHSAVRRAAAAFVRDADRVHADARSTTDRSYPAPNRIRFYLLTFDGVRLLEENRASIEDGRSRYSALFDRAQDVATELREIADKPK